MNSWGELADVGHGEGDPAAGPDHDGGRAVAEAVVHHHLDGGVGGPGRPGLAAGRPGAAVEGGARSPRSGDRPGAWSGREQAAASRATPASRAPIGRARQCGAGRTVASRPNDRVTPSGSALPRGERPAVVVGDGQPGQLDPQGPLGEGGQVGRPEVPARWATASRAVSTRSAGSRKLTRALAGTGAGAGSGVAGGGPSSGFQTPRCRPRAAAAAPGRPPRPARPGRARGAGRRGRWRSGGGRGPPPDRGRVAPAPAAPAAGRAPGRAGRGRAAGSGPRPAPDRRGPRPGGSRSSSAL